jgi:ABC-type multidrug transport system fused ATPase/permease subunit
MAIRPRRKRVADRVLVPGGAGIVEQGRPTELQAQGGAFARLFE